MIPSSLHAEVIRPRSQTNPDTGAPWTTREVSRWLLDTHGVAASRMAVTRLEAALTKRGGLSGQQALRDEMREAIDRAHRLGLQVIGQAVEDPQAAAALWMGGIDFIQGNLVQRAEQGLEFDFQHATL